MVSAIPALHSHGTKNADAGVPLPLESAESTPPYSRAPSFVNLLLAAHTPPLSKAQHYRIEGYDRALGIWMWMEMEMKISNDAPLSNTVLSLLSICEHMGVKGCGGVVLQHLFFSG